MRAARNSDDSLMALAVLQQCTRKNVGGVMSEDLFSYTNTGETKYIVSEFINEVVTTLRWITSKVKKLEDNDDKILDEVCEEELKAHTQSQKEKVSNSSSEEYDKSCHNLNI